MTKALTTGLDRFLDHQRRGMVAGLTRLCDILTTAMGQDPAHGDVTGASHANYAAKPFGPGKDPSASTASQAAVVEQLNPGHSATAPVTVPDGAVGAILDSATDYQRDLETEYAGRKAVLGPTIQGSADDFTRYAAEGARSA